VRCEVRAALGLVPRPIEEAAAGVDLLSVVFRLGIGTAEASRDPEAGLMST
jgi:hypothetical protein